MQSGFSPAAEHGSSSLVDSDVSGIDHVEGSGCPQCEDCQRCMSTRIPVKMSASLMGGMVKNIINHFCSADSF